MIILNKPRRAGKTHEAVMWVIEGRLLDEPRVLLTFAEHERARLLHDYPILKKSEVQSTGQYRAWQQGRPPAKVALDNLDHFFWNTLGTVPDVATITEPVELLR